MWLSNSLENTSRETRINPCHGLLETATALLRPLRNCHLLTVRWLSAAARVMTFFDLLVNTAWGIDLLMTKSWIYYTDPVVLAG